MTQNHGNTNNTINLTVTATPDNQPVWGGTATMFSPLTVEDMVSFSRPKKKKAEPKEPALVALLEWQRRLGSLAKYSDADVTYFNGTEQALYHIKSVRREDMFPYLLGIRDALNKYLALSGKGDLVTTEEASDTIPVSQFSTEHDI